MEGRTSTRSSRARRTEYPGRRESARAPASDSALALARELASDSALALARERGSAVLDSQAQASVPAELAVQASESAALRRHPPGQTVLWPEQ